jgi:P-type Cu+ transporter
MPSSCARATSILPVDGRDEPEELVIGGYKYHRRPRFGAGRPLCPQERPIEPTTPRALTNLKAEGIEVVMLTGDHARTAEAVARQIGVARVAAEVLPEQKVEYVLREKASGRVAAMAGDGINDAPALAAADVGIAMGTGTDVAIQSAGIMLVKGDLNGIARARRLSTAAMRVRQNLFFAFIYDAAGVPVAAGVLYPVLGFCCRQRLRRGRWP